MSAARIAVNDIVRLESDVTIINNDNSLGTLPKNTLGVITNLHFGKGGYDRTRITVEFRGYGEILDFVLPDNRISLTGKNTVTNRNG